MLKDIQIYYIYYNVTFLCQYINDLLLFTFFINLQKHGFTGRSVFLYGIVQILLVNYFD